MSPITKKKRSKKQAQIGYAYWALWSFAVIFILFLMLLGFDNHNDHKTIGALIQNSLNNSTQVNMLENESPTPSPISDILLSTQEPSLLMATPSLSMVLASSTAITNQTVMFESSIDETETPSPFYKVNSEDRLEFIASALRVTSKSLRDANFMFGDAIFPGQILIIPKSEPVPESRWFFASTDKDQADANYPSYIDLPKFRMHYMPNTYPSIDPYAIANIVEKGLSYIENKYGQTFDSAFDIYVAGTFFEQPNGYLRGQSFSLDKKIFFLHNGSGDAITQQYFATHELTHMYAWNTFGPPASFLVSEGAAVYTGMKMIAGSQYMPINTFCAVYKKEDALPLLTTKVELNDFRGHNNNLVNYYSSGCFVGYLIETYGVDKFAQVYSTNHYDEIYGKPLDQLEIEWKESINTEELDPKIDTKRLVNSVTLFMATNESFYSSFTGTSEGIQAYMELDKARLALLSGRLDDFDIYMSNYISIFSH